MIHPCDHFLSYNKTMRKAEQEIFDPLFAILMIIVVSVLFVGFNKVFEALGRFSLYVVRLADLE